MFSVSKGFRRSKIVKVVSLLLINTFLIYNVSFAQPGKVVSFHKGGGNLAAYQVSQLVLNEKAVERLDKAVTKQREKDDKGVGKFSERVERVKKSWVRTYLRKLFTETQARTAEFNVTLDKELLYTVFISRFEGMLKMLEEQNKLTAQSQELEEDIASIVKSEIDKIFQASEATPGEHSAMGEARDYTHAMAVDEILEQSFGAGHAHIIERGVEENDKYYKYADKTGEYSLREGFQFVTHDGLARSLKDKGLPFDIHPGRGGDEFQHGLLQVHIDSDVFQELTSKELVTIGRHDLAHLDIFNVQKMTDEEREAIKGTEPYETWQAWIKAGRPMGQDQETFVNSLPECDTTAIAERITEIIESKIERDIQGEDALNSVITSIIKKAEDEGRTNGDDALWSCNQLSDDPGDKRWMDVIDDTTFDRAIIEHNWDVNNPVCAPLGLVVHYGTRGTRSNFYRDGNMDNVEIHCYLRKSVADALAYEEKVRLFNYAKMRLRVSLGAAKVPEGMDRYEWINLQEGCDIRSFWKKIEQARRKGLMRSALQLVREGLEKGDARTVALGLAFGVEARIDEQMKDKSMLPEILMGVFEEYDRSPNNGQKKMLATYSRAFKLLNERYPIGAKDWLPEALNSDRLSKTAREFVSEFIKARLQPRSIDGEDINAVIMAGGGGTRMFPLSTDEEPKQLLSLIGGTPLVVVAIRRLIQSGIPLENIYIQTIPALKIKILELVKKFDLPMEKEQIFAEPSAADTAAAIGYAATKLKEMDKGAMPAFIATADHIIGDVKGSFKDCYMHAASVVKNSPLVATLGIKPDGPSPEYGHILVGEQSMVDGIFRVGEFVEKPKDPVAREYYEKTKSILETGQYEGGYLFNSGMFIATPNTWFTALRELAPAYYRGFMEILEAKGSAKDEVEQEVFDEFAKWKKWKTFPDAKRVPGGTSVDFALAEPLGGDKTDDVGLFVKPGTFPWTDIGSYKAVYEHHGKHMEDRFDGYGNLILKPNNADIEIAEKEECKNCLIFIGDVPAGEEDIKIELRLKGLENAMVIHNPKTGATMVAPMDLGGSTIKAIRASIGEKGPRWAHYLKGGKPKDAVRKSIFRSTQDSTRLFSANSGRVMQAKVGEEMHSDLYSDYGLVVLAGMRHTRIVQHKEDGVISISVGTGSRKDDFEEMADELRAEKVREVKAMGNEFNEERVKDFLKEGRIEEATISKYSRAYDLDQDADRKTIIRELVEIFMALAINEEDPEKRETFIKRQKADDMLTAHFVRTVIERIAQMEKEENSTIPRMRTAALGCFDLVIKYGDEDVRSVAEHAKKYILSDQMPPTKTPEEVDTDLKMLRDKFKPLRFGTSGLRDKAVNMSDLECYINTRGFIEYLISLGPDKGGIKRGEIIPIGGDLRPTTDRVSKAVARAITDSGCIYENLGRVPTPNVAYHALKHGRAGIMVTASHNPDDEQGIKFYKRTGEVLKSDEQGITSYVAQVREKEFLKLIYEESPFNEEGMFTDKPGELSRIEKKAKEDYIARNVDTFGKGLLQGLKVALYSHSAVGWEIIKAVFEGLGAEVVVAEKSKKFVPVDTENVDEEKRALLKRLAKEHKPFVVISTDGDSDRPLLADENGEFLPGDKLGLMTILGLKKMGAKIDFAAVPVSANDKVAEALEKEGIKVERTEIGSPYVIKAMNDALKTDPETGAVSFETNGGFLTGSDLKIFDRVLSALPTRDAALPLIAATYLAKSEGMELSEYISKKLPKWYTHADKKKDFSRKIGGKIVEEFSPQDEEVKEVERTEKGVRITYMNDRVKKLNAESGQAREYLGIISKLSEYFTAERGFDKIAKVNFQAGIKIFFENDEVSHLRPSGNSDEFRNYAQAASKKRAREIVDAGIKKIIPELGLQIAQEVDQKGSERPRESAENAVAWRATPGRYSATGEAKPENDEMAIISEVASILKSNIKADRVKKDAKIDLIVDDRLYTKHGPGSVSYEQKLLKRYLQMDIRITPYTGQLGLLDAVERSVRGDSVPVLVATEDNLKKVEAYLRTGELDVKKAAELRKMLSSTRMMALPEWDDSLAEQDGWFFTREVEGGAIMLATTNLEDLEQAEEGEDTIAGDLLKLMTQFTGKRLTLRDLRNLLPVALEAVDDTVLLDRLHMLLNKLKVRLPAAREFDAESDYHKQREFLWAA